MIVALLRVSTDEQETERQRLAIERYAEENRLKIKQWFEDKESRDLAEFRPHFQEMMSLVIQQKITTVLIEKFDRFGVSGKEEWFHYRYLFQKARCKLISVSDGEGELTAKDDKTMLMGFFAADASTKEQRNIAHRALSGKARYAKDGDWVGGPAPFGYDKVCIDNQGNVLWRLIRTGKKEYRQVFTGGHCVLLSGSPGKSKNERLRLDINEEQAEIVRLIFRLWTTQRISLMGIAIRLNREGYRLHGKPFVGMGVRFILRNAKYLGKAVWNEKPMGRFKQLRNGHIVDIPEEEREELKAKRVKTQRLCRRNPEDEWIVAEDSHPAIIDPATFRLAQQKLAEVKDNKNRAPRNERFWLKDLLYCGSCLKPMKGEIHKGRAYYLCRTYANADHCGLGEQCKCGRNTVVHDEAERRITEWLADKQIKLAQVQDTGDIKAVFQAVADFQDETELLLSEGWKEYLEIMLEELDLYAQKLSPDERSMRERIELVLERPEKPTAPDMATMEHLKQKVCDSKLATLESTLKEILRSKSKSSSEREQTFWQQEQVRIEKQMDKIESWAIPLSEKLRDAVDRCRNLEEQLEEVASTLEGGTNRQKAEALRRVIDRVVLHFRKEKKAVRCRYFLDRVEIMSPFTQSASRIR